MGRKKQTLVKESTTDVSSGMNSDTELKSVIHQHSLFFDKLIELIPARIYLTDYDKENVYFAGLNKKEKAAVKKETKQNIKKARRDRLDPEKSAVTTLDLLMQNLNKEKPDEESDHEEVEINPKVSRMEDDERSVTYEELRERLHKKIEGLQTGRDTGKLKEKHKDDREKKKEIHKNRIQQKKRKREAGTQEKKPTTNTLREKAEKGVDKVEKDVEKAAMGLKFSNVKLGNDNDNGKQKKRKISKLKELERAKELQEAKQKPEKKEIISKHSWKVAMNRAAGIKVHDDPKLLRESIKREKKRHQKNVEKWKERVESQQQIKAEKQQKRSQNIADRIQQKKMRRIAKREKKLLRPGFEGRKEGYINEGST